jgi:hypothetical protein
LEKAMDATGSAVDRSTQHGVPGGYCVVVGIAVSSP